jgi:hypothetical protein
MNESIGWVSLALKMWSSSVTVAVADGGRTTYEYGRFVQ